MNVCVELRTASKALMTAQLDTLLMKYSRLFSPNSFSPRLGLGLEGHNTFARGQLGVIKGVGK